MVVPIQLMLAAFHPAHEAGISDGQIVQEDDMGQ